MGATSRNQVKSATGWSVLLMIVAMGCDDTADGSYVPLMVGGDASTGAPRDTGLSDRNEDSGPATLTQCGADIECDEGFVCYDGRCVEGVRCDDMAQCPAGSICVAGLCFETPGEDESALTFDPARLGFSFNQVGEMMERGVTLGNAGRESVTVTGLRMNGSPTFRLLNQPALPFTLAPNDQQPLTISYTADDTMPDSAELIATEADGEVSLQLASTSKTADPPSPCLDISPRQIFFGSVQRGQPPAVRVFTLSACSDLPVTVSRIERGRSIFGVLPDAFDLDPPPVFPIVIQPGQSHDVTTRFTPMQAGIQGGFWQVLSDDGQEPDQRVDLSALSTPPELRDVQLHIRMSWTTDRTDVDLHLVGPGGALWTCDGDCYFSNGGPNWGDPGTFVDDPFLDLDDVDGHGPENINLQEPAPGRYTIYAHYWASHGGDAPDVEIEVIRQGQTVAQFGPQTLNVMGELWEVATIDMPAYDITPAGNLSNGVGGQAIFCP